MPHLVHRRLLYHARLQPKVTKTLRVRADSAECGLVLLVQNSSSGDKLHAAANFEVCNCGRSTDTDDDGITLDRSDELVATSPE